MSSDQFISEPIDPVPGTFDAAGMARGEAGLPGRLIWRGQEHTVVEVLDAWKTSSAEGGSGEMYLRRHWWRVRTDRGVMMTIYCERQKNRRNNKGRWFIYTLQSTPPAADSATG